MVKMKLIRMSLTLRTLVRIVGQYQVLFFRQKRMAVCSDMIEDILAEFHQRQKIIFSVHVLFFVLTFY